MFNLVILLPTECVTREQDPPFLRGAPPVHTRSYTLSVRWILNKLAFRGLGYQKGNLEVLDSTRIPGRDVPYIGGVYM